MSRRNRAIVLVALLYVSLVAAACVRGCFGSKEEFHCVAAGCIYPAHFPRGDATQIMEWWSGCLAGGGYLQAAFGLASAERTHEFYMFSPWEHQIAAGAHIVFVLAILIFVWATEEEWSRDWRI